MVEILYLWGFFSKSMATDVLHPSSYVAKKKRSFSTFTYMGDFIVPHQKGILMLSWAKYIALGEICIPLFIC